MPIDPGSTVPRRQLARHLRQLREDARITIKLAAEELEWSTPKIWRIEGGESAMRALDVEAMCRLYGAPPDITDALMALARETKSRGWWHAYGDAIPAYFELYVSLESAANRLRQYGPELIPGLLQTAAYATEVFQPWYARGAEPTTVYSDGLTGALYLDKPEEVAAYEELWASIVSASLDETQSMRLIAAIAKEYPSR